MWRKLWNDSDWAIIIGTFFLVCIGLAAIGSATHVNQEPIGFGSLVVKQLIFFLANTAVVIGMQFLNYHRLKDWGNIIYGITLLMLIAVMAVGTSALGAQRWIQLGPITIQPSEFSKLFLIRLNIQTHSVVMTTNTSKNHRCDINSQANVLYLSYNDSPGQLSAFPLTYCSIINCGNVSRGMAVNIGIPTRSTRTFHHFFKG